jgi:ribonucleoside-diphosphate reductase alpha chain
VWRCIFRRLALDYLDYDSREALGIFTAEERAAQVAAAYGGYQLEIDVEGLAQSVPVEVLPAAPSGPPGGRA